jgi:hypothetical protein
MKRAISRDELCWLFWADQPPTCSASQDFANCKRLAQKYPYPPPSDQGKRHTPTKRQEP